MKYFGYYADNDTKKLNVSMAAVDKMTYIAEALCSIGESIEIISAAVTLEGKNLGKKKILDNSSFSVQYFFSVYSKWKFLKIIFGLFFYLHIFFWCIKNVKSKEVILVYHSLGYMWLIQILKRLKKVQIILEIEEIYADVIGNLKLRNKEISYFQKADAYIFPTQIMDEMINMKKKPSVVIHGVYKPEQNYKIDLSESRNFETKTTIHCVYAGTFDPRKGGALAAIEACKFLTSEYHMHILGFGSEKDVKRIKKAIIDVNKESKCQLTYEGLLKGSDYIKFMQKCQIGLSTQNPSGIYNETSFPSKILSYLSNGLHVVSIRIPVVEYSAVSNLITYYNEQNGEAIARAIMQVDFKESYNSREFIAQLDKGFKAKIIDMIEIVRKNKVVREKLI